MSTFRRLALAGAAVAAWRYFTDDVAGADRRRAWIERARRVAAAVTPSWAPAERAPRRPLPPRHRVDEVDEASMESFPASDAPAYWGRDPDDG